MKIIFQQASLMNYHALFVIFEKEVPFEIVVCCKLKVALYGLKSVYGMNSLLFFGRECSYLARLFRMVCRLQLIYL